MSVELLGEHVGILSIYTVYKDGKALEILVLLTINNGRYSVMEDDLYLRKFIICTKNLIILKF